MNAFLSFKILYLHLIIIPYIFKVHLIAVCMFGLAWLDMTFYCSAIPHRIFSDLILILHLILLCYRVKYYCVTRPYIRFEECE